MSPDLRTLPFATSADEVLPVQALMADRWIQTETESVAAMHLLSLWQSLAHRPLHVNVDAARAIHTMRFASNSPVAWATAASASFPVDDVAYVSLEFPATPPLRELVRAFYSINNVTDVYSVSGPDVTHLLIVVADESVSDGLLERLLEVEAEVLINCGEALLEFEYLPRIASKRSPLPPRAQRIG